MIANKRFRLAGMLMVGLGLVAGGCATGVSPEPAAQANRRPLPDIDRSVAPPLQPSALRGDAPVSYTVQPGDTIWDVSSQYLKEPWRWKSLWRGEPSSEQGVAGEVPSIYAGNQVALDLSTGEPLLKIVKGQRPTLKLTPKIRIETVTQPIPTIPRDVIAPFIENSIIMTAKEWKAAPYIVGNLNEQLLPTVGSRIYARGGEFDLARYRVFRPENELRDPASGGSLGYAMTYVGEVAVENDDDPAALQLVSAERGARPGDRLVPLDDEQPPLSFDPHPVPIDTDGMIVGLLDSLLAVGSKGNVAINLGSYDGMEPGHVLGVYQAAGSVTDPVTGETVQLPGFQAGTIVLYRIFDLVSYGLVMEANRDIRVNDSIREPGA